MEAEGYPYYFEKLSPEEERIVRTHFLSESTSRDLVRVVSRETEERLLTVNARYVDHHHLVYNIKPRPDDVWIVTYPKCGTTWTQEIVWNIVSGVEVVTSERTPFIDGPMIFGNTDPQQFFQDFDNLPSPRIIKTHYPFELLPPNLLDVSKVIFVCRNVKDACVSYHHHNRLFKYTDFHSSFHVFAELFQPGNMLFGGYFSMLQSGWRRRDQPNLLMFWYEEIKQDEMFWTEKIMKHIGYNLDQQKLKQICQVLTFSNYKKISIMNTLLKPAFNEGRGDFTRKGEVGDWVNHFDEALNKKWNIWIKANLDRIGIMDHDVRAFFKIEDK